MRREQRLFLLLRTFYIPLYERKNLFKEDTDMRQSWKELWELNKLSVKWVAKHWKGYTLALIICYGIGYILGTGGFKNCKTYIENKLKKSTNEEES